LIAAQKALRHPVSLLFFVKVWRKQHVLKTDTQYSAFLNARGVR
jgi:hemerythrin